VPERTWAVGTSASLRSDTCASDPCAQRCPRPSSSAVTSHGLYGISQRWTRTSTIGHRRPIDPWLRPPRCCHGAFPTGRKSPALILAAHAWQLASHTVNDVLPSLRGLWVGLLVNLLDDGTADQPTSVDSAGPSRGVRVGCPACLAHLIRQQSWRSTAFAHVRLDRRRDQPDEPRAPMWTLTDGGSAAGRKSSQPSTRRSHTARSTVRSRAVDQLRTCAPSRREEESPCS
jgi:hypothetical protein